MSGSRPNTVEIHLGRDSLVVVLFPASWLRIELDDLDGDPRTAERPETLREVLARFPLAVAAVDAAMFSVDDDLPYESSARSRLLYRYLDKRSNVDVRSLYPSRGGTLSVNQRGESFVLQGDAICDDAVFAHQGYPAMILGGRNVASETRDTNKTGRATLLRLSDGRAGFATSRSGIRELASNLLSLPQEIRPTDAVYMDGGGSTASFASVDGRRVVGVGMDSRRVPAYLLAIP